MTNHEVAASWPVPASVDRETWERELEQLRVLEKAHTRAGDVLAARRRRLPMVEVDAQTPVTGRDGLVPFLDVFEGRPQLVVYFQMWHDGQPAEGQCEGCTFVSAHVPELSYVHSRDVTYATLCEGPFEESDRYRRFMGWRMPWYSARPSSEALIAGRWFGSLGSYLRVGDQVFETYWTTDRGTEMLGSSYSILDLTLYGRQEDFEESPPGWPHRFANNGGQWRTDGRPTPQWDRLARGHSDVLTGDPDVL